MKMEKEKIASFNLPTYREIPNVGLYLDQVSKYINECFTDLPGFSITNSMISNYVKHDIIANPVKKLYYRDQIACLIFITLSKGETSLDNLKNLLVKQQEICDCEQAYSYFSQSFNEALHNIFTEKTEALDNGETRRHHMVNTIVSSVVHQIYLNAEIESFIAQ